MNRKTPAIKLFLVSWPWLLGVIGLFVGWLINTAMASNDHIIESKQLKARVTTVEQEVGDLQGFERENLQAHSQLLEGQATLQAGQAALKESISKLR